MGVTDTPTIHLQAKQYIKIYIPERGSQPQLSHLRKLVT